MTHGKKDCPTYRRCLCDQSLKSKAVEYPCCGFYCNTCGGYLGKTTTRRIVKVTRPPPLQYKPIVTDKPDTSKKK